MEIINYFLKLLEYIGINIQLTETSNPWLTFACGILCLAFICLWCFVNILMYFISLYILETKYFLDIISKYEFLLKFLNFFKSIRLYYILSESIAFIFAMGFIIFLCLKVIIKLS